MKVEIQEVDPCKRQLVVEAPEEEVRAAWTAACGRVQRDARLPGFRRGKVPLTLVRSRFGDEVRQAVAEALIPVVYRPGVSAMAHRLRATISGWDNAFWLLADWYREGEA